MDVTSGLIDWFSSHNGVTRARAEAKGTAPGREFVNFLWPAGLGYHSPLAPVFLSEFSGPSALPSSMVWLARDGLIPLLWFFRETRGKKLFDGTLLVDSELAPYIPSACRSYVGKYALESDPKLYKAGKIKRLLLTGIMMDAYCELEDLEEKLERVCEQLGSARKSLEEVVAFIPPRLDGFGLEHRHEYLIDYVATLCRFFGSKVRGIAWSRFQSRDSWVGYGVCDLNSKLVCADSFMLHQVMGRGAALLGAESSLASASDSRAGKREKELPTWVSFSPYHGMRIALTIGDKSALDKSGGWPEEMTADFERRFNEAMRSEASRRFPWPMWFAHWAQALPRKAARGNC